MKVLIKRSVGALTVNEIDVHEIHNVKWDNISGGYYKYQVGYSLYGYITYSLAMQLVDCSKRHYGGEVKIMIPASYNKKEPYLEGYKYLANLAGSKPTYRSGKPCTKRILELLGAGPMERKILREALKSEDYPVNQIAGALKRMTKDGRVVLTGSAWSPKQLIEKVKK